MNKKTIGENSPVGDLFMVGESYAKRLAKLEIFTVYDLLYHFPHRHEDLRTIKTINQLQTGIKTTVSGQITQFSNAYTRYGKKIQRGSITDKTGTARFIFFNQPYLSSVFKVGQKIALSGLVDRDKKQKIFKSPEYEILKPQIGNQKIITIHTGRLVPVYPETYGVSSKWLRSRIFPLLSKYSFFQKDWLPSSIQKKNHLIPLATAIKNIHFPQTISEFEQAKKRLSFDELFLLQLRGFHRRQQWQEKTKAIALKPKTKKVNQFINNLPFALTSDQKATTKEVLADIASTTPANRLIQGDVGVGKTVVAAIAVYQTYLNQEKALLMAPTTILAEQHYLSLQKLFAQTGLKLCLVTSSRKKLDIKADLIIGTHALLHRDKLPTPAVVIIDEQHRFGVEQRAKLLKFKPRPHLITMTATPIPRTISLALYGDLDLSIIKQMPLGEKKIKTWLVPPAKRDKAYAWIKQQIKKHKSQAFIICPLIEESEHEKMKDIRAVTKEYENLKIVFAPLKLALLHGRMKAVEKEKIISSFKDQKSDILVSTPVIEVGIDIPQASIILIEGAERFGLAQLHQLRGRVGRRSQQSYCLLFPSQNKQEQNRRLKAMETHFSGFTLAEIDLKIRGPGEIYGRKQSGFLQLKLAILDDEPLMQKARTAAKKTVREINRFPPLQEKIKTLTITDVKPN